MPSLPHVLDLKFTCVFFQFYSRIVHSSLSLQIFDHLWELRENCGSWSESYKMKLWLKIIPDLLSSYSRWVSIWIDGRYFLFYHTKSFHSQWAFAGRKANYLSRKLISLRNFMKSIQDRWHTITIPFIRRCCSALKNTRNKQFFKPYLCRFKTLSGWL